MSGHPYSQPKILTLIVAYSLPMLNYNLWANNFQIINLFPLALPQPARDLAKQVGDWSKTQDWSNDVTVVLTE